MFRIKTRVHSVRSEVSLSDSFDSKVFRQRFADRPDIKKNEMAKLQIRDEATPLLFAKPTQAGAARWVKELRKERRSVDQLCFSSM